MPKSFQSNLFIENKNRKPRTISKEKHAPAHGRRKESGNYSRFFKVSIIRLISSKNVLIFVMFQNLGSKSFS